ncbi:DUF4340 domain-containing protein [Treponema brennaborense]|uniref:DUF4340 domain-containing protein n=1 Tax=Treponema brennaborense (strain DSM 12168 / CIP 105900 / DD5/3) TaxID=906968 RepID=F4LM42_TREBD|nr:DUF4340 domain-containing protein [Treponema brennaborense]AEE16721.1 hypothetical protein Trebr_1294 [Treponema brennaborense DSM 12168]
MTEKKAVRILGGVCCALALLYAASFFAGTGTKSRPRAVRSALLNPKYADTVAGVTISRAGQTAAVSKREGDVWIGTADGIAFPVESKTVAELLETVKKIRNMYIISDDYTDKTGRSDPFQLAEHSAYRLDFTLADGSVRPSLYFGANDYTGRRIYCRTSQSDTVYETEDDLFPRLKTDAKSWADMRLIPQSLTGALEPSAVQRIRITGGASARTLTPKDASFQDTARRILSARAGAIIPDPDSRAGLANTRAAAPANVSAEAARITVDAGDGTVVTLAFFPARESAETDTYYVVPHIEPGPARNGAAFAETIGSCSYALEISSWTFENLISPL